ncbi:MAG: formate--tetrahydrofolate ligase [Clostridia bacterium]|jgi:formate--tetrahydrofolate ligase|nr:formate--tetrahydrofolate ligase [Clostridia bacterium]MBT7123463.1 formate--tetrahydrofolate ligase [Clostridia bacterium]
MQYKTDLEIAQAAKATNIGEIAQSLGISENELAPHGYDKAKVSLSILERLSSKRNGKLILVSALNPTPAGEGKTTVSIGLADALKKCDQNVCLTLREPSLGPVFGIKGGAAGGGYAQVIPMEDINLHFTGDMHAITSANNLLCAMLDNHIQHGNALGIDPRQILFKRCMDMNDRQLRNITCGLGGRLSGTPREDGFDITAASEVMAILCLATDLHDLKERLSRIIVGYTYENTPVTAKDLKAQGAMAALLKDAIKPNLVQTLEQTPCLMHGGPFANIAHGCNSYIATNLALHLSDYVVTEAGFGADLGAQKFLDIKCRQTGLWPDAVVLVVTVRALKFHGGKAKNDLVAPDIEAVERGIQNVYKHIDNLKDFYGLPTVVAINKFHTDTDEEIALVKTLCETKGVKAALTEVWEKGGEGGVELAKEVIRIAQPSKPVHPYELEDEIEVKIEKQAIAIYGACEVGLDTKALKSIKALKKHGYGKLPICIAKTQYSLSHDATLIGAPKDFCLTVRDVKLSAGAGFIVVLAGSIMTMPGLPTVPSAEAITIDDKGQIDGLF